MRSGGMSSPMAAITTARLPKAALVEAMDGRCGSCAIDPGARPAKSSRASARAPRRAAARGPERRVNWAAARRVPAVCLIGMGDVLMTAPALAGLKGPGRAPTGDLALTEQLGAGRFYIAVILIVHSQRLLPATLTTLPLRIAQCRENFYGLLTNRVREIEPGTHPRDDARRHLAGHVDLTWPEAARLAALGLDGGGRWTILHPGANAPSHRSPRSDAREGGSRAITAGASSLPGGGALAARSPRCPGRYRRGTWTCESSPR